MPIETRSASPTRTAIKTHSDFVLCQNFAFRPADVDGFSHQRPQDSDPTTIVNFKSYTLAISDPDRRLFEFLMRKINPKPTDEAD
jgi:hypothetical protein